MKTKKISSVILECEWLEPVRPWKSKMLSKLQWVQTSADRYTNTLKFVFREAKACENKGDLVPYFGQDKFEASFS